MGWDFEGGVGGFRLISDFSPHLGALESGWLFELVNLERYEVLPPVLGLKVQALLTG